MDSLINKLSPHLFWDVDSKDIDMDKHQAFVVKRVLEYGLFSDWVLLKQNLGIVEIAKIATQLRTLDKKALTFISTVSHTPQDRFRCYITRQ